MNGPSDVQNYLDYRAAQYAGGQAGWVNSCRKVSTLVGPDVKNFEWNLFAYLENYSSVGENVATYSQARAMGKGVTWAGCFEVRDDGGKAEGLWGIEVDVMANGSTGWRQRYGIATVIGKAKQDGEAPTGYAAYIAGSIAQTATSGKWSRGMTVEIAQDACYASESSCYADRFAWIQGTHVVGFDFANGNVQQPIRLKAGQKITLEETGQIGLRYNPATTSVELTNGDTVMHSFRMTI